MRSQKKIVTVKNLLEGLKEDHILISPKIIRDNLKCISWWDPGYCVPVLVSESGIINKVYTGKQQK